MAIDISRDRIQEITLKLLDYCRKNDWVGYDPYDALNSKLLGYLPFLDFRVFRIGLTQLLKRSPINIRPLLLVPKMQNPKALALFLMAFLKLERMGLLDDKSLIPLMIDRLIALRSPQELLPRGMQSDSLFHRGITRQPARSSKSVKGMTGKTSSFLASQPSGNELSAMSSEPSYWCWGYSFPWQTRKVLVPRWAPNLVCTTFVANALLDAYEMNGDQPCREMAASAAEYIVDKLYWTDEGGNACFAYPLPSSRARVHNANFLGAALLCRIHQITGDKDFIEPALKVARFSASKQHEDGSWDYGEDETQRWIDNFHTGYNLCALQSVGQYAETSEFAPNINRGLELYLKRFFRENGAPRYYHDRTYPIDIHSVAQSIITLLALKDLNDNNVKLAHAVFQWAMVNMWDERGIFTTSVYPFSRTGSHIFGGLRHGCYLPLLQPWKVVRAH
jgi:hypothetical protein